MHIPRVGPSTYDPIYLKRKKFKHVLKQENRSKGREIVQCPIVRSSLVKRSGMDHTVLMILIYRRRKNQRLSWPGYPSAAGHV